MRISLLILIFLLRMKQQAPFDSILDLLLLSLGPPHIGGIAFSAESSGIILRVFVDARRCVGVAPIQVITVVTHAPRVVLTVQMWAILDNFGLLGRKSVHQAI